MITIAIVVGATLLLVGWFIHRYIRKAESLVDLQLLKNLLRDSTTASQISAEIDVEELFKDLVNEDCFNFDFNLYYNSINLGGFISWLKTYFERIEYKTWKESNNIIRMITVHCHSNQTDQQGRPVIIVMKIHALTDFSPKTYHQYEGHKVSGLFADENHQHLYTVQGLYVKGPIALQEVKKKDFERAIEQQTVIKIPERGSNDLRFDTFYYNGINLTTRPGKIPGKSIPGSKNEPFAAMYRLDAFLSLDEEGAAEEFTYLDATKLAETCADYIKSVADGRTANFLITGPKGSGKTRLSYLIHKVLQDSREFRIFRFEQDTAKHFRDSSGISALQNSINPENGLINVLILDDIQELIKDKEVAGTLLSLFDGMYQKQLNLATIAVSSYTIEELRKIAKNNGYPEMWRPGRFDLEVRVGALNKKSADAVVQYIKSTYSGYKFNDEKYEEYFSKNSEILVGKLFSWLTSIPMRTTLTTLREQLQHSSVEQQDQEEHDNKARLKALIKNKKFVIPKNK